MSTSTPLNLTTTTWTICSTSPPLVATATVLCFLRFQECLQFLTYRSLLCIPAVLFMLIVCFFCFCFFVCALTGATAQETDETDNFELNASANVSNGEPTIDAGQKRFKAAPKANRSVRFKRRASGNGKLADGPGGPGRGGGVSSCV